MSQRPTRPVIDNRSARNLFLARHGLSENPRQMQSRADLLSLIERIGFVQVDSINTVARAHDMILFARNQTYRPDHLNPETPSVTYCGECGRERTEAEKGTRTPCPTCGSTSFVTRIHIGFGIFHHFGLNVSIKTQKSFEIATYKATFREMDMTALRGVCEGSKKQISDIPVGYELDVQAIAKHVYRR